MSKLTILTLLLSSAAVLLATFACFVASRGSGAHQSKLYEQQRERLQALTATVEAEAERLNSLRSRIGMLASQLKTQQVASAAPPSTGLDASDEEKARARRELGAKLASGAIKTIGR